MGRRRLKFDHRPRSAALATSPWARQKIPEKTCFDLISIYLYLRYIEIQYMNALLWRQGCDFTDIATAPRLRAVADRTTSGRTGVSGGNAMPAAAGYSSRA